MQQQVKTERRVRLNETAYEHAKRLIAEGRVVLDERGRPDGPA